MAPDAKILPLKVWTSSGGVDHWASKEQLNAAFKWIYDYAAPYRIASVNMSWGFAGATRGRADGYPSEYDYNWAPTGGQSIAWYLDHLRSDRKVLVVQAAGNTDSNWWQYGGRESDEVAVGSLNSNGSGVWGDDTQVESNNNGSSYGQDANYVDVLAPGWNVTVDSWDSGYTLQPGYTSYATPWIAGAAALLKQVNPDLSPTEVMTILKNNNAGTLTDGRPRAGCFTS